MILWSYPSGEAEIDYQSEEPFLLDTGERFLDLSNGYLNDYNYSPIYPVVSDGKLIVNDGSKVVALDLKSDGLNKGDISAESRVLWKAPPMKSSRSGLDQSSIRNLHDDDLGFVSVTVAGDMVFFWTEDALYGVDEATGSLLMKKTAPSIEGKKLKFNGVPIVHGDNIFVPMVRTDIQGETRIYVVCFSRSERLKIKWKRYLGVAFNFQFRREQQPYRRRFSHLVHKQDTLYIASNMGLVGALNSVSGNIKWIHDYSPYGIESKGQRHERNWKPTKGSKRGLYPPKIYNDVLYVLPWDSPMFLGFQLETGKKVVSEKKENARGFIDIRIREGVPLAILIDRLRSNYTGDTKYGLREVHVTDGISKKTNKKMKSRKYEFVLTPRQLSSVRSYGNGYLIGTSKNLNFLLYKDLYLDRNDPWPHSRRSKLDPYNLISTKDRLVLAGAGRIVVIGGMNYYDRLLKNISSKSRTPGDSLLELTSLLIRSGQHNQAMKKIREVLTSTELFLAEDLSVTLRRLYYRLALGRMYALTSESEGKPKWKEASSVGQNALSLLTRKKYVKEIAIRTEEALFKAGDGRALVNLHWRLERKFGEEVISPWQPEGERTNSIRIRVGEYLKLRRRKFEKSFPLEFGFMMKERRRALFPEALENRLPEFDSGELFSFSRGSNRYSTVAPEDQTSDPLDYVLSFGPEPFVRRNANQVTYLVKLIKSRNRIRIGENLSRLLSKKYPDRTFPASREAKAATGKELSEELQTWLSTGKPIPINKAFKKQLEVEWTPSEPAFWNSEESRKDGFRPIVVNQTERFSQPDPIHDPVTSEFDLRLQIYNSGSEQTEGRFDIASLIGKMSTKHLSIRTSRADNGWIKVIVNNTDSWTSEFILLKPTANGQLSLQKTYTFEDRLLDTVSLSRRRIFVSAAYNGSSGEFKFPQNILKWGLEHQGDPVLESYTRSDKSLIWSRTLNDHQQIVWLDSTWDGSGQIYFVMRNGNNNSGRQVRSGQNSTDQLSSFPLWPGKTSDGSSKNDNGSKNSNNSDQIFGSLDHLTENAGHVFGILDMTSGSTIDSLKLRTPWSYARGTSDTLFLAIPVSGKRHAFLQFDTRNGKSIWNHMVRNCEYTPHIAVTEETICLYNDQSPEGNPPTIREPLQFSNALHSGKGWIVSLPSDGQKGFTSFDMTEYFKDDSLSIHIFPTTTKERFYLLGKKPADAFIYKLVNTSEDNDESEWETRWKGIILFMTDSTPPILDGRVGPAGSFVVWHNFHEYKNLWRVQVFHPDHGKPLWLSGKPGEKFKLKNKQKNHTLPLPDHKRPVYAGNRNRIGMIWNTHIFKLVPEE